jgi:hypothetical protein
LFPQLPFSDSNGQLGRLVYSSNNSATGAEDEPERQRFDGQRYVPCLPLDSLLLAINRTRVDYLSLDVEGHELDVLETISWSRFDIRTISVEYKHVRRGKKAVADYMTRHGYRLVADLHASQPCHSTFVDDFFFVKT